MPVDKSATRIRNMFSEIAGRYDFMNRLLSVSIDQRWRRRTVRTVAPDGDRPILDVCTGTGDLAIAYYRATGGNVPVVGSDFCTEMLDVARRKKEKIAAGENLEFVEADAMELPFDSDRFQIVSVAFGLRNIVDTDAGLAEMVRVCAPGGRVAVLEFSRNKGRVMGGIYGFYFKNILPRVGRLFSASSQDAYQYLPESVDQFPDGQALADRMSAAGLCDVFFDPLTLGVATLYVGTKGAAK